MKAGSRNETYENTGISHALRIAAGLATKKSSAFNITRNLQQLGANLTCTQGREHTLYTVQVRHLVGGTLHRVEPLKWTEFLKKT